MRIDIQQAVPGMILDSGIVYNSAILVGRGSVLTARYIEKLKAFGITSIDVVSDKKDIINENNQSTIDSYLFESVRTSLMERNYDKIKTNARSMVTSVLNNINLNNDFSNLTYDLRTFENTDDTLNHSIRVAIYSIVLAYLYNENLKSKNYDPKSLEARLIDLKEITVAALLHDRAQKYYGNEVLKKVGILAQNSELTAQMPGLAEIPKDQYDDKYVSLYSYCLVSSASQISSKAKYMILFSSETENNTGPLRPIGFESEKTNSAVMGAKIIYLCGLYDNMLAHCLYGGESFENIVSVLGQAANTKAINKELSDLFLSNVPIYPIGTKVVLSNGEKAEVVKTFVGYTYVTRPVVRILSTNQLIDLRYEQSLTIGKVYLDEVSISDVIDSQVKEMDGQSKK